MKGDVVRKGNQHYAVIYEGTDPLTGHERRRWQPAGPDRDVAERLAAKLADERMRDRSPPTNTCCPACNARPPRPSPAS